MLLLLLLLLLLLRPRPPPLCSSSVSSARRRLLFLAALVLPLACLPRGVCFSLPGLKSASRRRFLLSASRNLLA